MEIIADAATSAVKMAKRIILLAAGLIMFGLGCIMVIIAREWLSLQMKTNASQWIYFLAICIIMAITNYLTMLIILGALRSSASQSEHPQVNFSIEMTSPLRGEYPKIYHYSKINICVHFSISFLASAIIFTLDAPGSSITVPGRIIEFSFSAWFLFYAIYKTNFYLKISPSEIIINGLWQKKILMADVVQVRYVWDRGGRSTEIATNGGKKYSIIYTLKNHYQMADTLATLVGKGRWTSSDLRITKHFKEAASRVATHLETDRGKEGR